MDSKKTETVSDNELISQFYRDTHNFSDYVSDHPSTFKFDTSWDWLMPVLNKIKQSNPEAFKLHLFRGPLLPFARLYIDSPINEVYKAVVEFIKWYNQQKP
jgi:hypothetical protein